MVTRRRGIAAFAAATLAVGWGVALAAPASAQVLSNQCNGTARIVQGSQDLDYIYFKDYEDIYDTCSVMAVQAQHYVGSPGSGSYVYEKRIQTLPAVGITYKTPTRSMILAGRGCSGDAAYAMPTNCTYVEADNYSPSFQWTSYNQWFE